MVSDAVHISCRGLHKSFGDLVVLKDLDLDIARGETIVVLGFSGTGKSVLLKHVNGLIEPDAGSVKIDGRQVGGRSEAELVPLRMKTAMLFQSGALFDSLTVGENVSFPLDHHKIGTRAERRDRTAELLEVVGLAGTEPRMPSELSGGMRKRAALARALAVRPEIMLYDEPTTGLDPITADQINELIRSLQEKFGLTSIVVTHDIHSACFVADRMAFLYGGKILEVDTVDAMIHSEQDTIRRFLALGRGLQA